MPGGYINNLDKGKSLKQCPKDAVVFVHTMPLPTSMNYDGICI